MGQQQSKDELLYHQVSYGNVEGIKTLRREGAGLEWIDKEGKTPLIVACMMPDFIHVAKTLIELGANLNAYRAGSHAGTPLHHAAKRGLEQTVKLLLYHGAYATAINDDCQTPLDLARAKGHTNVVRTIESHICQFSGWLRELHGPSFLEALAPQWVSRKIWAVVIPCESRNPRMPQKFELAIYSGLEIAQPRTVIQLWKGKVEEPKFNQPDPALVILDKATKTKFKFLSANEGDKQQLQWFYNACIGVHQLPVTTPAAPVSGAATAPAYSLGQQEVPMPISASMPSAMQQRPPIPPNASSSELSNTSGWENSVDNASHNGWGPQTGAPPPSKVSSSDGGWIVESASSSTNTGNGWSASGVGQSSNPAQDHLNSQQKIASTQTIAPHAVPAAPSAPPAPDYDGPVHYPTIDVSAIDLFIPDTETTLSEDKQDNDDSSALCAICLDAPKEGACVPCGHVVGCMSCLNDIKAKDWGCPVCRTKISQVIKLYKV